MRLTVMMLIVVVFVGINISIMYFYIDAVGVIRGGGMVG